MRIFQKISKLITLSIFTAFIPISCDNSTKDYGNDNYGISSSAKTRINIYKQEAKLLLEASENNLDILELCENIKKADTLNNMSHLTERLEKVHAEIANNYDAIAKNKLISIPSYIKTDTNINEVRHEDRNAFIKSNLSLILNKTKNQIQLLDALGNITNNVDFKVLVIKDSNKLKSNVDRIQITLNTLNERIQKPVSKNLLL